jgi:hypothetical protein
MKTITVNIPEGHTATYDEKAGQIRFSLKRTGKVEERILTIADALAELGEEDPEVVDLHLLQGSFCAGHQLLGYQTAVCITKALNEGWTPDWSNSNELKYYPWFEMRGSSGFRFDGAGRWHSRSGVGSRLCFKSRELAVHAGERFTEVYKQFMVIE